MTSGKILLSMGTRPEIIKMAPIYNELRRRQMNPLLLHTGQHSDMATALYDLLDIAPDYILQLDRSELEDKSGEESECDLATLSSILLRQISRTMMKIDPDIVLVHGDTSSAFISALAAFYQKRPVAHVEAGLRSHDEYNPFPEEKNRVLIAQIARWHFAPTACARDNLLAEGIKESRVHMVGNTIIEAAELGASRLETHRRKSDAKTPDLIHKLTEHHHDRKIVMVTAHRRENQDASLVLIAHAVAEILTTYPDVTVVWPVHPNPKVKRVVHKEMEGLPVDVANRLYLTNPLSYPVLLWILKKAWLALTDSGGIQEEAVALNTPVLVLRETTERPEVIEAGGGIIVGTDPSNILRHVKNLYQNKDIYSAMRTASNPFGDGQTSKRICDILNNDLFSKYRHEEAS